MNVSQVRRVHHPLERLCVEYQSKVWRVISAHVKVSEGAFASPWLTLLRADRTQIAVKESELKLIKD